MRKIIQSVRLCIPLLILFVVHPVLADPNSLLAQIRRQNDLHGQSVAESLVRGLGLTLRGTHATPVLPVIVDRSVTTQTDFFKRLHRTGGRLDVVSRTYARLLVPLARLGELIDAFPDISLRAPVPVMPDYGLGTHVSQSVALTAADGYQAGGLDGAGTRVAIVDVGFANLNNARNSGELPATACDATHSQDFTGTGLTIGDKHGTGVAEHVADMAPGAQLYCLKVGDEVDLQNAAAYLAANQIDIANHSAAWAADSYYDDTGPVNDVINGSHDNDGVFWTVAAGNYADKHWRGIWKDNDSDGVLEFSGSDERLGLTGTYATVTVFLNWDQYGVANKTNLNLYVMDAQDNVVASSTVTQTPFNDPLEGVSFAYNSTQAPYSIKIINAGGANASGLDITVVSFFHGVEYQVAAASVLDPASAHGAFTVGAVYQGNWQNPSPSIEPYSSQGPTTDGRGKPDLVAPDGTSSLSYATASGTSFSAPTVAGAAALLLQEDLQQSAATLRSRLLAGAIDIGAGGTDDVFGAGKLQLPLIDTDGDGLDNVSEIQLGTDAQDSDTDNDGLTDYQEVQVYTTDPLLADTDGDQVTDGDEVLAGTDPKQASSYPGDGDVNADGNIDVRDLLLVLRHVQGQITLSGPQQVHADTDRNSQVNTGDVAVIQQRVLSAP